MTHQPTTVRKDREHFPAVILPSGKTRILTDVGFYSQSVAMGLATDKVAKRLFKKLTVKPKKISHSDVNYTPKHHTRNVGVGPATEFPLANPAAREKHTPTIFHNREPHPDGDLIYEIPDVHKTDESHGSLDHLGVPGALPDQTPTKTTAIELCRLFNVNRTHVELQHRVETSLTNYELGRRAAMGGKGKRSCPYVKGGIVYYDWMDGFNSYSAGEAL